MEIIRVDQIKKNKGRMKGCQNRIFFTPVNYL